MSTSSASSLHYAEHHRARAHGGDWLFRLVDTRPWIGPALARVGLGVVMFPHGAQKLFGWFGGQGFTASVEGMHKHMGIPAPLAVISILTESIGALMLVTGTFTRLAALGMAIDMLVALFVAHAQVGFFMNWFGQQKGEGFEYHILAIALGLTVLALGGGLASIDRAIARALARRRRSY